MDVEPSEDLAALHRRHYPSLVRLAALLGDRRVAEEVVQDAFVRVYAAGGRVRDPLPYLRRAVVNGARSSLRRRRVRDRAPLEIMADADAPTGDRTDVMRALNRLPARQRECLVLRYYGDLSEADIAAALDISTGSVKTHASRGLAALASALEES